MEMNLGVGWNWFGNGMEMEQKWNGNGMKMEIDKKFVIELKINGIEMKLKAE